MPHDIRADSYNGTGSLAGEAAHPAEATVSTGPAIIDAALEWRNIRIGKRRSSIRLEQPFWDALEIVAHSEGRSVWEVLGEIDRRRTDDSNFASAVRAFLLQYFQNGLKG